MLRIISNIGISLEALNDALFHERYQKYHVHPSETDKNYKPSEPARVAEFCNRGQAETIANNVGVPSGNLGNRIF